MSRSKEVRSQSPLSKLPRKKAAKTPSAAKNDTLGPRPVSARQQALREGREVVARPPHPASLPPLPLSAHPRTGAVVPPDGKRRKSLRDADTTRTRVKVKRAARNRRRINVPKVLLGWAAGVLVAECVAVLLFSPRLWVKRIIVEGNQNVSARAIVSRLKVGERDNIVRLPVAKLSAAVIAAEPEVETVDFHRDLRDMSVRVVVKERQPWACIQTPDHTCYTIDQHMVPFQVGDVPPVGLPLLKIAQVSGKVPLGKPMTTPGLSQVSRCLAWARTRNDFPLDAVSIDSDGKLCLNRAGGARFLLGSGQDLDRKLKSLETLLGQRSELRDATNVAYVNLLAYDAPAVRMRSVSRADSVTEREENSQQ